jgi:TRAP transporter TAXI family solute receptor
VVSRWFGLVCALLLIVLTACNANQPVGSQAVASAAQAPACTPEAASTQQRTDKQYLVVATGGTGGVFFAYGGGLARVLSAKLPNAKVTAEVTGGSVDNINLVDLNDADLGFSTVDSAYEGSQGQGVYQQVGPIPICTIATLYQSFIHVVALDGLGINSLADLRGKRVSVGSAGSSTEAAAYRLLEAAGLDPKVDVTRDNLSVGESVAAMKDRKLAAFFWIGGLPTSVVTDLVATPGMSVKFLPTEQYIGPLTEKYGPVYASFTMPKGVYKGVEQDTPGIGVNNILFVNSRMPEQQVYNILKTFFDNLAEVQAIHPEAKKLKLETAATGSPIPFHPGAIRFYKEKGVWKP